MPKNNLILVEENNNPQALIIGANIVVGYLAKVLTENGCTVTIFENYPTKINKNISNKYNYIFLFNDFAYLEIIKNNFLSNNGKILIIESDKCFNADGLTDNTGIIKIGEFGDWDLAQLTEKILKTIFARRLNNSIDLRKRTANNNQKNINYFPAKSIDQNQTKKVTITQQPEKNIALVDNKKVTASPPLVIKKFRFKKLILNIFLFLFISLIICSSIIIIYIRSLYLSFSALKTHIASGDLNLTMADFTEIKTRLSFGKEIYNIAYKYILPLQYVPYFLETGEMLTTMDDLAIAGAETLTYFQTNKNTNSLLAFEFNVNQYDLEKIKIKINNLASILAIAKKKMDATTLPGIPKADLSIFLAQSYDKLLKTNEFLPFFEDIFLAKPAKTYLIILQNNMELRPTGGFIGSYGLLTAGEGKILDFKIFDVYTADGQLKGHVEPPLPIRKYLNQPNWFLRDSNFDPDFAVSAARAVWFLQKEMGIEVNGVIGINLFLAQDLLKITGPLTISDFDNDTITADNFFFKAQYYSQDSFFSGSTQKKDFLTAVSKALQNKLLVPGNLSSFELIKIVSKNLEEKNLLLYSTDQALQKKIEDKGWAGRMVNNNCSNNNANNLPKDIGNQCAADYLAINEANLGVNKANYFINKTIAVEKKLEQNGQLTTNITVNYQNSANGEILPGGTYTSYLRFIIPLNSSVVNLSVNNIIVSGAEIDKEVYSNDKISVGTLIKVTVNSSVVVKFSYTSAGIIGNEAQFYQFFFQKQGGDKVTPLIFSFQYPSNYVFNPINFKSTTENKQEVYFTTDTSVDRIFVLSRQ